MFCSEAVSTFYTHSKPDLDQIQTFPAESPWLTPLIRYWGMLRLHITQLAEGETRYGFMTAFTVCPALASATYLEACGRLYVSLDLLATCNLWNSRSHTPSHSTTAASWRKFHMEMFSPQPVQPVQNQALNLLRSNALASLLSVRSVSSFALPIFLRFLREKKHEEIFENSRDHWDHYGSKWKLCGNRSEHFCFPVKCPLWATRSAGSDLCNILLDLLEEGEHSTPNQVLLWFQTKGYQSQWQNW